MRDDLLTDLSLIDSIHTASSSLGDEDARAVFTSAVTTAPQILKQKLKGHNITIEFEHT